MKGLNTDHFQDSPGQSSDDIFDDYIYGSNLQGQNYASSSKRARTPRPHTTIAFEKYLEAALHPYSRSKYHPKPSIRDRHVYVYPKLPKIYKEVSFDKRTTSTTTETNYFGNLPEEINSFPYKNSFHTNELDMRTKTGHSSYQKPLNIDESVFNQLTTESSFFRRKSDENSLEVIDENDGVEEGNDEMKVRKILIQHKGKLIMIELEEKQKSPLEKALDGLMKTYGNVKDNYNHQASVKYSGSDKQSLWNMFTNNPDNVESDVEYEEKSKQSPIVISKKVEVEGELGETTTQDIFFEVCHFCE